MQIEIATHDRMSESGSSLLRLIQNNDTCRLDLLVRESIQNCLDAGDGQKNHASINVDFSIGSFETSKVAGFFDKISGELKKRYSGEQNYIAIRDSHTTGLTGPVRYDDVENNKFGNLLKLIYEISKPQDLAGSGGSWGLGKTVYFRIGIGLVLYYSQIKKKGIFGGTESRLAAALVEDETKDNTILPSSSHLQRGIAWWGKKDPKNPGGKHTVPITDNKEIEKILKAFNIKPFEKDETGTVILIPFIDKTKLLEETISEDMESANKIPFWCKSTLEEYIKIAIQRWYAPRLNNEKYQGQYLQAFINGVKLDTGSIAPIFRLIQVLYNTKPGDETEFNDNKICCQNINVRETFQGDSTAGWIKYTRVNSNDMKMTAPDNYPNPFVYVNKSCAETYNDPIILYTRKPGMIVSYCTTGEWTDGIPKTQADEYIIGLFVANSDKILKSNGKSFEDYLRNSEKADHMAWEDWAINGKNPQTITKMRRTIRKKIKEDFVNISEGQEEKRNLGLGKMLAEMLLPPTDFVFWDDATGGNEGLGGTGGAEGVNTGGTTGGNPPVNSTGHAILKQNGNPAFDENGITLPVRVLMGKRKTVEIRLNVDSERGTISGKEWESITQKEFPAKIKSFTVEKVTRGKGKNVIVIISDVLPVAEEICQNGIRFGYSSTEKFNIRDCLRIVCDDTDNLVIDGWLTYELNNVQGSLLLKEEVINGIDN